MDRKHFQFSVIALAVVIAVVAAWFLYTQSSKFTAIRQESQETSQAPSPNKTSNETQASSTPESSEPEADEKKISRKEDREKGQAGNQSEAEGPAEEDTRQVPVPVAPQLVEDLGSFLASKYQPERSLDNPLDKGRLRISFKALNTRYGTDLTGFRHYGDGLQEARDRVLELLMRPDIMTRIHEKYAERFLQELVESARDREIRVKDGEGDSREGKLQQGEISEMLGLYADYLRQVAAVAEALGQNRGLDSLVKKHLRAQRRADSLHEELIRMEESAGQKERQEFIQGYEQALRERQKHRQELVSGIKKEAGQDITLASLEILSISKWFHRRLSGGASPDSLITGAELLRDTADRLDNRAGSLTKE